jgi:multidrug efflux pump subunit AcrB
MSLPAQIDVRTVGYDRVKNLRIAKELVRRIGAIPGVVDAHLQQEVNGPEFLVNIDRARATQFGLNVNSIALNLNTSLSSSEQIAPNFWTDPSNGTPYYLTVQTPEPWVSSLNELKNTPVATFTATGAAGRNPIPGLLSNVATLKRDIFRPTPIRPTSSRSMNSLPMPRTATSAASRATSIRSWPSIRNKCRPATL